MISSFPPPPIPHSRSSLASSNIVRALDVGTRPCEALHMGIDEGAPTTPAVPAVDLGLHGGSSRISPCARLIPAAEQTLGSGSQAHAARAGEGSCAPSGSARRGRGAPGGGAGKPADLVSVLRPLQSRCLPGSGTEEARAAQAEAGGGHRSGRWGLRPF